MPNAAANDSDASFLDGLAAMPPGGGASEWWPPLDGLRLEKTPAWAPSELGSSDLAMNFKHGRDRPMAEARTLEHVKGLGLSEPESTLKPQNVSPRGSSSQTTSCLPAAFVGLSCANYSKPFLDNFVKEEIDLTGSSIKGMSCNLAPKRLEPNRLGSSFKPTHHRKQFIGKDDHVTWRRMHIYLERQRRRNTSSLFATLRSLLPEFEHTKADRCTVLTEVVEYIGSLRERLKGFEHMKMELISAKGIYQETSASSKKGQITRQLSTEPFVTVISNGGDGQIVVHTPKGKGLWPQIFLVLERRNSDVVNSTRSTGKDTCFYHFHVKIRDSSTLESEDLVKTPQHLTATWLERSGSSEPGSTVSPTAWIFYSQSTRVYVF